MRKSDSAGVLPLPPLDSRPVGSYWRASEAFVHELAQYAQGKRVLEVFAGNGLLAGCLHAAGVRVQATTRFSSHDCHEHGLYYPVEPLDAVTAVTTYGQSADLLLVCWPTVTSAVLTAVEQWGVGREFVYIGEVSDPLKGHWGGCADDAFFSRLHIRHQFLSYKGNIMEIAAACYLS